MHSIQPRKVGEYFSSSIGSVVFSPDGQTLVCGGQVWNSNTGEQLRSLGGSYGCDQLVAISPDGQILAGGEGWNITVWSLKTGEELHTLKVASVSESIAISPDGQTLASGNFDGTIKLWNVKTGKEICTFQGHSDSVESVAISPDGQTLVSGSWDHTIKIWRIPR